MAETLKVVSEYDDRRRELDQEVARRHLLPIDPGKIIGATRDERYVNTVIQQELAFLAGCPAGARRQYPNSIPTAMRLASLRLADWLSPEARVLIDVGGSVMEGCAQNGSLALYGEPHLASLTCRSSPGEPHLMKAMERGIVHAEPRPMPPNWGQHQDGHIGDKSVIRGQNLTSDH